MNYVLVCVTLLLFNVRALTVDNQLVNARNDCFERIALEAMLPFEKTFRTEDTNSLMACKEMCIRAGDNCQAISFGVHRRGNGTCQLSSEKIDSTGSRPPGTIFDPDFDLYARKTNCFDLHDNTIPIASDSYNQQQDHGPSRPTSVAGSPILIVNSSPTTPEEQFHIETDRYPAPPTPTDVYSTNYPTSVDNSGYHSTKGPSSTYGNGGGAGGGGGNGQNDDKWVNSGGNGDRIYFSHDVYPLYQYPMLYEQNYPSPNQEVYYPGGYAQNSPTLGDRYKPSYPSADDQQHHDHPRPIFGLGYGNGYSYGKPVKYDTGSRPTTQDSHVFSHLPDNKPIPPGDSGYTRPIPPSDSSYSRPIPSTDSSYTRPMQPSSDSGYTRPTKSGGNGGTRPNYDETTSSYLPRPGNGGSSGSSSAADTIKPNNGLDYTNRPDPAYGSTQQSSQSGGYGGQPIGPVVRPPKKDSSPRPGYGYVSQGQQSESNGVTIQQQGYNDDKMIATFFNPDDYGQGNRKMGQAGSYPNNPTKACFRRVLAGKRVAPHWVRRTIACERVEDCMRECGHEKRFMCEGFNYRLDPSGHGQGDCELIEVPLAQMDLYSSPHQRDSNLLRHPDYDYYERDRNAPSSCRKNPCRDCPIPPQESPPSYFKPSGYDKPYSEEHYIPPSSSGSSGYGGDHYNRPGDTSVDRYRPPPPPRPPSSSHSYESSHHDEYNSFEFSSHGYYEPSPPSSYGGDLIDRYDSGRPDDRYRPHRPSRPSRWEAIPSGHGGGWSYEDYPPRPEHDRDSDRFRPPYRPGPDFSPYRPHHEPPSSHGGYSDHDKVGYKKPPPKFVPYQIGVVESDWGSYGGSYGGHSTNTKHSNYWGIKEDHSQKDPHSGFNYFELGGSREPPREHASAWSYPGSRYGGYSSDSGSDRHDYKYQWTRRPGPDECSAKTSEGFRLHKTAIKHAVTVPTITECERLCSNQNGFICQTYSYRYTQAGRDNCMLCDRPVNHLDYYVDIEPDRDYDIYSMSDDLDSCRHPSRSDTTALSDPRNAQCFFRAIDATRFFKSIVRDSLTVRSIGECELECIKSVKFTCRAFAFRYGPRGHSGVIDNCQLSDWPVRDMDKQRHLILDPSFDVFERASYGHGCEIQPIVDEKHKKLCYLGYGSPAKLLSTAIKKIISVASEVECKKECIRYRENTSFKCYSFSFGSQATTFNCEMSDLDQTELKLNIHYTHTPDRDYWLFAWNPFDWTCRDKVNTIGGTRVNNDRRMDIFREPGDVAWRHYTVSGKPCRVSSPCEKNLVTGFYSCEIETGEIGSWDYCCKADHPCGYSQGFDYPWCFVGDEPDQWRKCSDRYYPGNKTTSIIHTHSGITLSPHKDKKKSNTSFQRPPRPGGLQSLSDFTAARLWPVTYLYSEGPPNATEFSNFVDCNKESC
ncbi:uncharacterized protein LOC129949610 isoform X2 [Eupeodes corollae]|uniref:uncharacterized protein LOC129949610 isoform X2 n=1 Tax=Eupeodes corollae TaxID=290404 RepID=UPI002492F0C8|nr:uncharacterized protein LOC129949610 isoform X2 [Eupeodes corollae]